MESTNKMYIHESINSKTGIYTDGFGNPIIYTPKEAHSFGRDVVTYYDYVGNEVLETYTCLNLSDRGLTKEERKDAEHEYRQSCYENSKYWSGTEDEFLY